MASSSKVELVIYDLSHGMARQLSAQFLGPQYALDIIPHTALVVFGREYFFGGGIQHEYPHQFRRYAGMHPIQTLPLGETSVSRSDFEAWCQQATNNGRYSAASYDLLERNCNNFSHDAATEGLRLSQGVPEWILQVPQKFLSSPMGQFVRPVLQNMQVTGGSRGGGGPGTAAPFASAPTNSFTESISNGASVPSAVPSSNPWASLPSTNNMETLNGADELVEADLAVVGTKTLDSFNSSLLSRDSQTIPLCAKKLVACLEDAEDQKTLDHAATILKANDELNDDDVKKICTILYEKILPSRKNDEKSKTASVMTFALMLLRVVVLHAGTSSKDAVSQCLDWIAKELDTESGPSHLPSTASRTLAWLVLANVASLPGAFKFPGNLVESTLLADWSVRVQPRAEVRQAAASFAYNYVLQLTMRASSGQDDVLDQAISLLCASLDGIDTETDATTRLRRLLVAGRILRPVNCSTNEEIKLLVVELGFVEVLRELALRSDEYTGSNDASRCRLLANELIAILIE
jgi:hypothetical protein